MTTERIMVISFGAICMLLVMLSRRKLFLKVKPWKMVIITVLLTLAGVLGAILMYWVENKHFGGTSFFGALLFVPLLMLPVVLLKIPYGTLMDLCAPAECIMLAVLKIDCLIHNCCSGRYIQALGINFPSQLVEMAVILLIMVALLRIEKTGKKKNKLYGYYLIFYGFTRFFLNFLREALTVFVWILPPGNFWSIIAVIAGICWLRTVDSFEKIARKY